MKKQILLFAAVGISSGLVNIGVYNAFLFVLRWLRVSPSFDFLIAQIFGFVLSVAWSFLMNRRFVFTSGDESAVPWYSALIKTYAAYAITGIGLSSLLSLIWVYVFHIPKEILTFLNDIICFPVNFLLHKYWAFRK